MAIESEGFVLLMWSVIPLVVASAAYLFFIISSLAIARSRLSRLEELLEQGQSGAGQALRILNEPDQYLLCTQFGRLLSSISAGFSLALCLRGISRLVSVEHAAVQSLSIVLSCAVVLAVLGALLVLVQVAKAVSLQYPESMMCKVSGLLSIVFATFGPVLVCAHRVVARVLYRFNIEISNERDIAVSSDDLSEIVKISSEKGTIEKDEQALIEGVVELSERITREVMTPRSDIVWVKEHAPASEIVALFTREGVSRVLVCGRDLDEVRGILLAKDLFPFVGRSFSGLHWQTYIRPAYFVPDTKPVQALLKELRQRGVHLAVVLNEHGSVDGVVTLEDLVEEIVGDIFDEFDPPSERGQTATIRDGIMFVDGVISIERIRTDLSVEIPQGEYDTLAGFVLAYLGRLPGEGDSFQCNGWEFLVTEVHKHRIARVAIKRLSMAELPENEEGESLGVVNSNPRDRR